MARLLLDSFLCLLLLSVATTRADKAPYDQQPVATGQGYKVSPEAPKHSKDLGGYSQPGPAPAAPAPNYASYEYNSVNQGKDLGGSFTASNFGPSAFAGSSASGGSAGGYGVPSVDTSYGPPSGAVHGGNYPANPPSPHDNSYTYYYQHYPTGNRPGGHAISPGDESIFDGFGDGLGLAGLGGLGGLGGLVAVAKGILALKPFLLFGLLLLLAIPVLLFFLPIPIITVSGLPSLVGGNNQNADGSRQHGPSMFSSYMSSISDRVLNSEECLERIICKLPQAPNKFQGKAKILWETYGKKYFSNSRIHRALNAYFDEATGRSRISKCNQKFKCSHKFL